LALLRDPEAQADAAGLMPSPLTAFGCRSIPQQGEWSLLILVVGAL
jgi:hypothetical protein